MAKADVLFLQAPADRNLKGRIQLSASKSISNRLLIIRALSGSDFAIENIASAEDTRVLADSLANFKERSHLDVGAAGTSMRFLTAFLAIQEGQWTLTGSERMQERPIGLLVETLQELGAAISYEKRSGFPPLSITGKAIEGGTIVLDASISSQFISALLMIAPNLSKGLQLELRGEKTSEPYIQLTLNLMRHFGAKIEKRGNILHVHPVPYAKTKTPFWVEADWSSAAFWYAMVALSDSADLYLDGLQENSLQGDRRVVDLFAPLGVKTVFTDSGIHLQKQETTSVRYEADLRDCPDLAQALAVVLAAKNIPACLSGLHTLPNKETDRLQALETELNALGCAVRTTADSLFIEQRVGDLKPHRIATYADHRMAMAFAPLVFLVPELEIEDPEVVKKSYPGFWEDIKRVGFSIL